MPGRSIHGNHVRDASVSNRKAASHNKLRFQEGLFLRNTLIPIPSLCLGGSCPFVCLRPAADKTIQISPDPAIESLPTG